MAPALRQSTASSVGVQEMQYLLTYSSAEFRGPGVRHQFDDSPEDFELDLDHRTRGGFAGKSGRIILLGDGTEVLTDSDDAEMFDHSEEDKDLESQVRRGPVNSEEDAGRSEREGTPAPQSHRQANSDAAASSTTPRTTESPSSINTEHSESPSTTMKPATDGVLPTEG